MEKAMERVIIETTTESKDLAEGAQTLTISNDADSEGEAEG